MPTPTKGPRLGGGPAHERLILANLATSLFEHDSITTTEAKAKRLRPLAERLITFAKRGDLHARRRVMTVIRDKGVVHRLFVEIAPDMAERNGGYTRITKIGPRKGDNAPMAVIELVREPVAKKATVKEAEGATKRAAKDDAAKRKAAQDEAKAAAAETKADEDEAKAADTEEHDRGRAARRCRRRDRGRRGPRGLHRQGQRRLRQVPRRGFAVVRPDDRRVLVRGRRGRRGRRLRAGRWRRRSSRSTTRPEPRPDPHGRERPPSRTGGGAVPLLPRPVGAGTADLGAAATPTPRVGSATRWSRRTTLAR